MIINTPHLYITYWENRKRVSDGPFFTASFQGSDGKTYARYEVQDASGNLRKVSVPIYHTVSATVTAEGFDIR